MRLLSLIGILNLILASAHAQGDRESTLRSETSARNPFSPGATEVEALAGAFFSVDAGKPTKPTINLASENVRFGIMLTTPRETGFLPGNTELLFEGFGAEIFTGPGSVAGGLGFIVRYNLLLRPQAVVVPYAQIGGGGSYSDISRTQSQALLGTPFNFTLQGGLGVRVLLNERCSLLFEHDIIHLSNAGSSDRNHGLNALGGLAGLAYAF